MQAIISCIDTPTAQPLLRPRCGTSQLHGLSNPWRMGSAQHVRGALQGVGMRANAAAGVQQPRTSPPAATPRWSRLLSLASATSTAAPVSTSTTHQPTYDLFPIPSSTMLGTSAPTVAPPAPPAGFSDPDSSAVNALTIGNSSSSSSSSSSSGREAWQRQGKLDLSFSTWLLYCNAYAASDQYQDRYRAIHGVRQLVALVRGPTQAQQAWQLIARIGTTTAAANAISTTNGSSSGSSSNSSSPRSASSSFGLCNSMRNGGGSSSSSLTTNHGGPDIRRGGVALTTSSNSGSGGGGDTGSSLGPVSTLKVPVTWAFELGAAAVKLVQRTLDKGDYAVLQRWLAAPPGGLALGKRALEALLLAALRADVDAVDLQAIMQLVPPGSVSYRAYHHLLSAFLERQQYSEAQHVAHQLDAARGRLSPALQRRLALLTGRLSATKAYK